MAHNARPIFFVAEGAIYKLVPCSSVEPQIAPSRLGQRTHNKVKPLYNLLELMEVAVMVVNTAHMKAVPGRKTDVKDAEWITELLQHGLLKTSSIPSRKQRELLRQLLDHIDDLNRRMAVLDEMVEQYMADHVQAQDAIDEIPGIVRRSAQGILAEIGLDMGGFPAPPTCAPIPKTL